MTFFLRLIILSALIFSLAGWTAGPDDSGDGLEQRQVRGLDEAWIRPDADFSAYRSLALAPVEVSFDPNWDPRRAGSRLPMSERDREEIRAEAAELFDRSFRRELERAGPLEIVETAGVGSLIFEPRIVDLVINAPEDRRAAGRVSTYVTEFGRMTLVGELKDGESGIIVAHINDRVIARAMHPMEYTDRFTNTREGERIITRWALNLGKLIDELVGH